MYAIIDTAVAILDLYSFILLAWVVMSWLLQFGVVNRYNRGVATIADILDRLTEPALRPIRRVLPSLNGLDLSPLVLFFLIRFLERLIAVDFARLVGGVY